MENIISFIKSVASCFVAPFIKLWSFVLYLVLEILNFFQKILTKTIKPKSVNIRENLKKYVEELKLKNESHQKEIEGFISKYNSLYILSHALKELNRCQENPIMNFLFNLCVKNGSDDRPIPSKQDLDKIIDITEEYCQNTKNISAFSEGNEVIKTAKREYIKNLTNPEIYPHQLFQKIHAIFLHIQEDFLKQFGFHPVHIAFTPYRVSELYHQSDKTKPFLFTEEDILQSIEAEIQKENPQSGKEKWEYCKKGISKYLELISITLGTDHDYNSLFDVDISKTKPLLKIKDQFFCCNFIQFFYLLPYQLEKFIKEKSTKNLERRYSKFKSQYAENLAYEKLVQLFGKQNVFRNLHYEGGEIDTLVYYDNKIIIFEIKSGKVRDSSLSGNLEKLKSDLKNVLHKSFEQSAKAISYIAQTEKCTFYNKEGDKELTIPDKHKKNLNFFSVAVHTENLMSLVNNIYLLENSNQLINPWAVNLLELEIILNHIKYPSLFIHYLKSRTKSQVKGNVSAIDELSLFGFFLEQPIGGFEFPNITSIITPDHIKPFDDYYIHQSSNVPEIKLERRIESFIKEKEKLLQPKQFLGHTDVLHMLLTLNGDYLENFLDQADKAVEKTKKDKSECSFFVLSADNVSGIGFLSCLNNLKGAALASFLAEKNKYKHELDQMVYLFKNVNDNKYITDYVFLQFPHKQTPEGDKFLKQIKSVNSKPQNFMKATRGKDGKIIYKPINLEDKCFCNSNKKYKDCCWV